jgi:hypothetical protein
MAALSSQRFLIFTGKGGPSFPEFVMNFKLATAVTNLDDNARRSSFFSHFDGPALTYLYRNPDLLKMPLDEAIAALKRHYIGEKPINPARIGKMAQEPDESVTDFLRRMTDAMHCMPDDPPPNMTADEAQVYEVTKEAQAIQAQAFIKPYFMDGIKPELKGQLGRLFEMKLTDMAKELEKYETFRKEYPEGARRQFGVAMIQYGESGKDIKGDNNPEEEYLQQASIKYQQQYEENTLAENPEPEKSEKDDKKEKMEKMFKLFQQWMDHNNQN